MATSGTYNYSVTASGILTEALEYIQVLANGGTIDANDQTSCLRTLNMMVKQWSGNFDFAPGLKAFSRKTGFVFLQKSQGSYSIGTSGDNSSLSYIAVALTADAASSATTLSLLSAGMTVADKIGIELDSGSIHWTTIATIPGGGVSVTITTGLTGAAALGRRVFTYTNKLNRPLYLENVELRDVNGNDSALEKMTQDYYDRIPVKTSISTPSYYLYDNTLSNGLLLIDSYPNIVTNVLRITFMLPAENYDAATNDIAYPQEWYMPLSLGLAKLVAPKFGYAWSQLDESNYSSALSIARGSYAETCEDYFQPELE